jgi:hypothetical protein
MQWGTLEGWDFVQRIGLGNLAATAKEGGEEAWLEFGLG